MKNIPLILLCILYLLSSKSSNACTNVIVSPGASADGSTIVSYAADSHNLYGYLHYESGNNFIKGDSIRIYDWETGRFNGVIPQVEQTISVVGNMNEYQVTIAETTFGGREELQDTLGVLDYGSLIYITLQRAKTAKEAIKIMTNLVENYGYYSSGESFSIADSNEAWIMEMIGKGVGNKGAVWVAVKIPDGYISAHANQSRIGKFPQDNPEMCLYHKDVINLARSKGYYEGKDKDFSFYEAYAPIDFGALRFCEARVWSAFNHVSTNMQTYFSYIKGESEERVPLWIKPDKKVSYRDVIDIMRDHYEGTELDMTKDCGAGPYNLPYRFRPLVWEMDSTEYFNERAIATQQTAFSFVAQMRNWLPAPIGGILWFGVDDAATSVYIPVYCGINEVPEAFAKETADLLHFSWKSAFWMFNWVANMAYGRYSYMSDDVIKCQKEIEDKLMTYTEAIDQSALNLYRYDKELAHKFLTDYVIQQTSNVLESWEKLGQFLMVKYLDGNLHEEEDGIFKLNKYGSPAPAKHPGYSNNFYKSIVNETKDRFQLKE